MVMATKLRVSRQNVLCLEPKFRDPATMAEAELTDPDYRIKKLAVDCGLEPDAIKICSKCHHCR